MSYKLHYFPFRGRGEQVRLMLHALDQPFEDVPVRKQNFIEMKQQGPGTLPFGSLPVFEDGDLRLAQGPVIIGYLARKHGRCPADLQLAARADAIALAAEDMRSKYFSVFSKDDEAKKKFVEGDVAGRWLPSFEGLLEQNGTGYFVGDDWTHADIAVWDALDAVTTFLTGASTDGYSRITALREKIAAIPGLAKHVSERPDK